MWSVYVALFPDKKMYWGVTKNFKNRTSSRYLYKGCHNMFNHWGIFGKPKFTVVKKGFATKQAALTFETECIQNHTTAKNRLNILKNHSEYDF
jgi:predicted GIY-YIG superfamily endonuclease